MAPSNDPQVQPPNAADPSPNGSGRRWAVTVTLIVMWLFAILGAYFWAHKPLPMSSLPGLAATLVNILVWLLLGSVAAGLGRRLAERQLSDDAHVVRLCLSLGLGLGILSLAVLALGLVGLLTPLAGWALLVLCAASSWRQLLATLGDVRRLRIPSTDGSRFLWCLAAFAAICLAMAFLLALTPPTGWDALVYHLTGPRLFFDAGRIEHSLDLPYLGFPQLGEMMFALGLLLAGDGLAALIHFSFGLSALCLTTAMTHRFFGGRSGWYGGILLLSVPTFLSLMSRAYVDLTLLFYAAATVYAFLRWTESGDKERRLDWLLMAGVFAGMSCGTKYTAIPIPIALGLATLWASRRAGLRVIILRLLATAGAAMLVTLPWLLENWLTTGNPVYPFFFGGRFWDDWRAWWYDRPGTGLLTTAPWRLLTAPLEATVLGVEGGTAFDATIGPLILATIPLLAGVWFALKPVERSRAGYVLLFFAVAYVLWLFGLARSALLLQTRLLLPAFGAASVLGGVALDRLPALRRPQFDVDWIVRAALLLALVLLLLTQAAQFVSINPLPVILGQESRHDFLSRGLGTFQAVMDAVTQLPDGSKVGFLWEPRSYGCLVPSTVLSPGTSLVPSVACQPDALLDRFLHLTHMYPDARSIAADWKSSGVTHILLNRTGQEAIVRAGFDPVTSRDLAVLEDLTTNYLSPIADWGDAYTLYEVKP